jgi:hypothetical protein
MLSSVTFYLNFDDSGSEPVLSIPQSSIAAEISWDTVAIDNIEPFVMGLLQKMANYSSTETDELANVFVSQPTKSDGFRNNQNKRTYSYTVTFFLPDSMPDVPDGDNF